MMIPLKVKKNNSCSRKMFNFGVKIFKLQDKDYDFQSKFFFFLGCCMFVIFVTLLLLFYSYIAMDFTVQNVTTYVVCLVCASIAFLLLIIFKKQQIFLFFFVIGFIAMICYRQYDYLFRKRYGTFISDPNYMNYLFLAIIVYFGNFFLIALFMIIQTVITTTFFLMEYILELDTDYVNKIADKIKEIGGWGTMGRMQIFKYIMGLTPIVGMLGIILYYKIKMKKVSKQIDEIGDAILKLNLKGEKIQKFLEKNQDIRYSSRFDVLFMKIISNLTTYFPFLPDSIRNSVKDDDDDDKKLTAICSGNIKPVRSRDSIGSNYSAKSNHSSNSSKKSHMSGNQSDSQIGSGYTRQISYSVEDRDVSILRIFVDFTKKVAENKKLNEIFSELTDKIVKIIGNKRGDVYMHDGVFKCFFNSARRCIEHSKAAVESVIILRKQLESFAEEHNIKFLFQVQKVMCHCGNLHAGKFFLSYDNDVRLFTNDLYKAHLQDYGYSKVIIDGDTYQTVRYVYDDCDRIDFFVVGEKVISIYDFKHNEVIRKKDDEWLYEIKKELEPDAKTSEPLFYSEIWKKITKGNFNAKLVDDIRNYMKDLHKNATKINQVVNIHRLEVLTRVSKKVQSAVDVKDYSSEEKLKQMTDNINGYKIENNLTIKEISEIY